jgi:gliding motility-associated-like protein
MEKNKTVFRKINKFQVILVVFLFAGILVSYGQTGCPQVPKSILDGANGFSVEGKSSKDDLGYTTKSAGDINHDGIADLMIGAPGIDFGGLEDVGEIYVIFGGSGFSFDTFDVTTLNGTNGFVIRGVAAGEKLGSTLSSAGDFNNDGIDDIIIGDNFDGAGLGTALVFFGANTFQALYNRTDIVATKGMVITCNGNTHTTVKDVCYAGDVNHDGISDVIITEYINSKTNYYVVFGRSAITSISTSSLTGISGFNISGYSVSWSAPGSIGRNAGDINNDGIDDMVLGFPSYHDGSNTNAGRVAIVFGKNATFPAVINLDVLSAADGSTITNSLPYNEMGKSVAAAGDFNNDGVDDVIIGVPGKELNGIYSVGEAYVIFGTNALPGTFSITSITPGTGVVFQGNKVNDQFGFSVAGVRDINHDGKADIGISSKKGISNNGALYLVFGGNTSTGIVKENTILNTVGYQIFDNYNGYPSTTFAYDAAGIGDFNNDGTNDFILGSVRQADYYWDKGNAYIFYGETLDRIDAVKPTIECPTGQELFANSKLPNYITLLTNLIDNCTYTNNFDLVVTQNPPEGTLFTGDTNVTISVTDVAGNTNSCSFLVKLKMPPPAATCKTVNSLLYDLDGTNGFTIYGETGAVKTGYSVNKAGDINGDGIGDFIVGAIGESLAFSGAFGNENNMIKGTVYVVYGKSSGFPPVVYLGDLNGTNGFIIRDDLDLTSDDETGSQVAFAGDINGDGIDDFMLSSPLKRQINYYDGAVYVIFGKTGGFPPEFFLSSINGTNGFKFTGTEYFEVAGIIIDNVGDFNNDGHDDIGISGTGNAGKAYVLYGKNGSFPPLILSTDLNGINGAVITNDPAGDKVGGSIAGLGDVNGDGIPDIAVASYEASKKFVIYGRSGFPGTFNVSTLNGTNGFVVDHSTAPLAYSEVRKVGDLNHDGFNDIAFNKYYVLFGSASIPASVDLNNLNGTNGFKLENSGSESKFGSIGDFNKDGIDDYIFIGSSMDAYVLYGKTTWTSPVNITSISAKDGLKFSFNYAYNTALNFAGDVNHDGIDDIILGANKYFSPFDPLKVNTDPGRAYVIYGRKNVADTEKPVIHCPANKILAVGTAIPDYKTTVIVTDNCDDNPLVEQTPAAGTIYTGGILAITLKATDASTNFQTCTFNITNGTDTEPPTLTCPGNQQLACGTLVPSYINLLTVTDNIDTSIDVTQYPGAGSTFFDGMQIDFTAKDDAGNESHCSIIVNASGADTQPPTFTCPTNLTLNCGDLIPNYAIDPMMNLADNCSENVHYEMTPADGTPFYDGISIHIKYTDESGNWDECTFVVHSATPDITKPVINCIANQTLACGATIPDYTALVSATDNCVGTVTITQNPAAGSVFIPGMSITMTATDVSNNFSNCSFIINASADVTKPVITCIGNQTLSCGATVPDYTTLISATDNCDTHPVITQNPVAGSTFTDGMTITITATDASNNFANCSFLVNASADVTKPVITCIGNQTLSCGATVPDYTTLVSATDNCDPHPVITQSPVAGSVFTSGMTLTITATDVSTNFSTCSFIINASADVTKPVITCIGNQILSCGSIIPDYRPLVTVHDNCDASPVITQSPAAGSVFTDGMTVTITATDASNNQLGCSFLVNASADVTKPVLTCIGNQTLACSATIPDYTTLVSATDNCDTSPVIVQNPVAGSAFIDGMTVTITAKDVSNNEAICSFIINASADVTKPAIICIGNQTLSCGATVPDYTILVSATDNCDPNPIITQNPIAGSIFTSGMTLTLTAKDVSGNYAICSFIINASADQTGPVIICAGNQTLSCGSTLPDYTPLVSANDNCDSSPIITQSPAAGSVFTDGMTITMTATDASNNTTNCSFIVNASADVTKPTITCIGDQNLQFGTTLPDYRPQITVSDNCDSDVIVTQTPNPGTAISDGMNIQITAADDSGNIATCSFVIHVITDTHGPVFTCLADQLLSCKATVIPDFTQMIVATDDFDPNPTITQNPAAGTAFQDGMSIKISVSDKSNNVTNCSFNINSNPVIVDAGNDEQINEGQSIQLDAVALESGTYQWIPSIGLNNSKIANPVATPTETTTYKVIFKNQEGCEAEDSVTITVIPLDQDETKYGFSPNGDGINDFWEIDDITQYPTNKVSIYNRWGDLVFQTQGYNNSTNVFAGIANKSRGLGADVLPEGTYFFEINVDQPHHFKKLKGYLVLKR